MSSASTEPLLFTGKPRADLKTGSDAAPRPIWRFTTFSIVADSAGGFSSTLDAVDRVFTDDILTGQKRQRGFLDCRRLFDPYNGECVVATAWQTPADAARSRDDSSWYAQGQQKLWPLVRYGRFKTQHLRARVLLSAGGPADEPAEPGGLGDDDMLAFGPHSRVTSLTLRDAAAGGGGDTGDGLARARAVAAVDALFTDFVRRFATAQPGFRAAQRFVGSPLPGGGSGGSTTSTTSSSTTTTTTGASEYLFVTHWDSIGTLRQSASKRSASHERAPSVSGGSFRKSSSSFSGDNALAKAELGKVSDAGATASESAHIAEAFGGLLERDIAKHIVPGSPIETREYTHSHLNQAVTRVPVAMFEAGSARAATFQLACISLGVGIFVMPGVFATMGLLTGTVLVLGWALACDFAMQMALRVATHRGVSTYEGVLQSAFGEAGRKVALASLVIACWTANCAHFQFISQMFVKLQGSGGGFIDTLVGGSEKVQQSVTMLMFGLFALPFCFKRRLGELRHVSLLVVGFCLSVSIVVCAKLLHRIATGGVVHVVAVRSVDGGTFADQVPIAAFGYSIIAELFAVRAEAHNPEELGASVHRAAAIVGSIYCAVGIIGALACEDPGENVLAVFAGDRFIHILELGLVVCITLLYPLINFPTVAALDSLIGGEEGKSFDRRRLLALPLLASVILTDALLPGLGTVFGLAGSLGLGLIAFCLPTAAFLAAKPPSGPGWRTGAWIIFLAGLGMTVGSTARILYVACK